MLLSIVDAAIFTDMVTVRRAAVVVVGASVVVVGVVSPADVSPLLDDAVDAVVPVSVVVTSVVSVVTMTTGVGLVAAVVGSGVGAPVCIGVGAPVTGTGVGLGCVASGGVGNGVGNGVGERVVVVVAFVVVVGLGGPAIVDVVVAGRVVVVAVVVVLAVVVAVENVGKGVVDGAVMPFVQMVNLKNAGFASLNAVSLATLSALNSTEPPDEVSFVVIRNVAALITFPKRKPVSGIVAVNGVFTGALGNAYVPQVAPVLLF